MTLTHITTEQAEAAALARVAELETFLQGVITELRARIAELESEAASAYARGYIDGGREIKEATKP